MIIQAKITVDLSPALQQLIENLIHVATVSTTTSEEPRKEATEVSSENGAAANIRPTLEQLRAQTAEKVKINKEAVRKALAECGAENIPSLEEDRYTDYLEKLAAI